MAGLLQPADERIRRVEEGLVLHPETRSTQLRQPLIADRMETYNVPGVSVAVVNGGVLEWARGYGVREAGRPDPVTPKTLFRCCSISKMVSALGALRLVAEGRIGLDEDVNDHLRSWKVPKAGDWQPRITLRHLLSHTAGISLHGAAGGYPRDGECPTLLQILNGERPSLHTDNWNCGLGTFVYNDTDPEARYFGHTGGHLGWKASLIGYERGGKGAVVLVNNGYTGTEFKYELLGAIAREYDWNGYLPPDTHFREDTSLDSDAEGAYRLGDKRFLVQAAAGGILLTAPDQNPLYLGATTASAYKAPAADIGVEFHKEADRSPDLLLRQGGREWRLTQPREARG